MEPQAIANQSKTNCHAKPAYAAAGNQTASLGVSEVPRVSPRAECRGVQCLPCVCVVLVTRTGSMGVHPYSKETRVPRQPRGFPGVRVDCCWMIFLPFSGMFLSVLVDLLCLYGSCYAPCFDWYGTALGSMTSRLRVQYVAWLRRPAADLSAGGYPKVGWLCQHKDTANTNK